MSAEIESFVHALSDYVRMALPAGADADYCKEAVQILDARNGLFRSVGVHATDEEHDIYTLRSLCRLDEETFDFVPDEGRIRSVARNYF
ncbi:MAG: hypothetical protein IJ786_04450 [Bacteroidaceae bacterium]|nr:hypothetical protein [Bacteroidaceae bacterium]